MSLLPFGVLVTHEPEGTDADPIALRDTRWFSDSYPLVQLPSIQSLDFLRRHGKKQSNKPPRLLGFGDPLLGQNVAWGNAQGNASEAQSSAGSAEEPSVATTADKINRLTQLPGTASELAALTKVFASIGNKIVSGKNATERAFRDQDHSSFSVLAFATHGLMADQLSPGSEPGLVLTPSGSPSSDDGFLTASEVSELNLEAKYVLLSACNTAAGDAESGAEGLSGLVRAFFYAGALNLLASHWPVRDDVAPKLTVKMMQLMRSQPSMSAAEALQRATKEVRESGVGAEESLAHPSAWAPFMLIGEAGAGL